MASDVSAIDWTKLTIGMLGGDKREQEIARRAAATGADVRAHGFPWPERGIPNVKHLADPAQVLSGARFALIVGDDEAAAGTVAIKPLRAPGEQHAVAANDVGNHLGTSEQLPRGAR